MAERVQHRQYDVVVLGGGAAGVVAALAASECGAKTALIERGTATGGELIGGLAILGSSNSRGEWLIGGPAKGLIDRCDKRNGFVGRPFDGRTMWGACIDPEVMKLVVPEALDEAGVSVFLGGTATDVIVAEGSVHGVLVEGGPQPTLFTAPAFVDASGDAHLAGMAGAECQTGADDGTLQPVSLTFRASPVDYGAFLTFVRDNPNEFMLAENPIIQKTAADCAADIYASGMPFVCMQAERSDTVMRRAMDRGELYPTTGIYMWPTSPQRGEMGLNTTRLAGVNPLEPEAIGRSVSTLSQQVEQALNFVRTNVPGFADAQVSGVAPRVGIRETRRIVGEERLETDDVVQGRKRADVVAKGGHHVDVHGSGTYQERIHVRDGRSYDIPYGALIPKHVANVLVAGRCFSSSREANGSARHMGSCMAMGQAAGTAGALVASQEAGDARQLATEELHTTLVQHGAVLDGVA